MECRKSTDTITGNKIILKRPRIPRYALFRKSGMGKIKRPLLLHRSRKGKEFRHGSCRTFILL